MCSAISSFPEFDEVRLLLERAQRGLVFTKTCAQKLLPQMTSLPGLEPFERLLQFLQILKTLARERRPRCLLSAHDRLPHARDRSRLQAILNYLHEHYREEILLEEVAEAAHFSPAACCRFFKQQMGRPLFAYLNELRVEMVAQQLRETDASVGTLAFEVGYRNLSNFNRQFSAHLGMNPSAYRQALRRNEKTPAP
jgi:AraC-like DNA-binding protein